MLLDKLLSATSQEIAHILGNPVVRYGFQKINHFNFLQYHFLKVGFIAVLYV